MITLHPNLSLMQAANCWLCLHIGSSAVVIGRWPAGYGMRIEICTEFHWLRVRLPISEVEEKRRRERKLS